jgi:hypothetical protein
MMKKDKLSLGKSFISSTNYGIRIILLHTAFLILFLTLSLLFWGAGHGSAVPFVVFFSPFLTSFFKGNQYSGNVFLLLQMPLYCWFWWVFYKCKINQKYLLSLPIFHLVAAIIAVFFAGINLSHRYYYWFLVSNIIMYSYWRRYFSLLKKAHNISHKIYHND